MSSTQDLNANKVPSSVDSEDQNKATPRRHSEYYSSGLVVIQVEDVLYRTDIRILKHFQVFRDMFEHASEFNPDKKEGQVDENPIKLEGATSFQFESLLKLFDLSSVFHGSDDAAYDHWAAILHLATMWDNSELRERAIQEIERLKPNPAKSIHLSQKYDVPKWMEPACIELCKKEGPITAEEVALIGVPLLLNLCPIRERLASLSNTVVECRPCGIGQYLSSTRRTPTGAACYSCGQLIDRSTEAEASVKRLLAQ
ncbi:hypothetical protein FRC03_003851 [Tulasnella sp. 419]|nr:hypothetical protein FRC03_003851 [Tulasnella sp. 419]